MMLHSLLQAKHPAREQVWSNAVATAIGCRILSRYTSIPEGEAFLSGLLHDVGKLIIIRRAGQEYDRVVRIVGTEPKSFVEAEEQVLQLNHVEVGTWVGESWNFPPSAVRSIAEHHEPWSTDSWQKGKNCPVPMLVKAADTFAHSLGLGHPPILRGFKDRAIAEREQAFAQLGLDGSARDTVLGEISAKFEKELSLYQSESQG